MSQRIAAMIFLSPPRATVVLRETHITSTWTPSNFNVDAKGGPKTIKFDRDDHRNITGAETGD
jgi:hypothetical protein